LEYYPLGTKDPKPLKCKPLNLNLISPNIL
jgi:hypothetical protein